jgi:hypothetical protein
MLYQQPVSSIDRTIAKGYLMTSATGHPRQLHKLRAVADVLSAGSAEPCEANMTMTIGHMCSKETYRYYTRVRPVSLEQQNIVKIDAVSTNPWSFFHCWLNPYQVKLMRPGQAQRPLVVPALTQTAN